MQIVSQSDCVFSGLEIDHAFGSGHLLELLEHIFGRLLGELLGCFFMGFFSPGFVSSFFGTGLDLRSNHKSWNF